MERPTEGQGVPTVLDLRLRLAEHAVFRAFARETVVLDLRTGTYHGLNQNAGRMLEVLRRSSTLRQGVRRLAREHGLPVSQMEREVKDVCRDLLERGLAELIDADPD